MKKYIAVFALGLATLGYAQEKQMKTMGPPAGKALVGDTYGASVKDKAEKKAMTPADLDKKLKKDGKLENIAVKGEVIDVCEKKGCWLTIKTDNNEQFFVKMKDYAFFVPTALKGKQVVMEGKAERKITTIDEQKHYAEDAKKPQAEIDAIVKDKEEIRFLANGIKVVK